MKLDSGEEYNWCKVYAGVPARQVCVNWITFIPVDTTCCWARELDRGPPFVVFCVGFVIS